MEAPDNIIPGVPPVGLGPGQQQADHTGRAAAIPERPTALLIQRAISGIRSEAESTLGGATDTSGGKYDGPDPSDPQPFPKLPVSDVGKPKVCFTQTHM